MTSVLELLSIWWGFWTERLGPFLFAFFIIQSNTENKIYTNELLRN